MVIDLDDPKLITRSKQYRSKKKRRWRYTFAYMFMVVTLMFGGAYLAAGAVIFGLLLGLASWVFWYFVMPGFLDIENEVGM